MIQQEEQSHQGSLPLFPERLLFKSLGSSYHAIVNAVGAVRRVKPGVATQVVGRALDGGCNATGRESRNHLSCRISGRSRRAATRSRAGVVSSVVGVG